MTQPRQRIGDRYELFDEPGSVADTGTTAGGAGAVRRCIDLRSGLQYSATILPLEPGHQDEALGRLLPVIDAITQLAHPNIVAAQDVVPGSGWVAVITRPLPAESLRSLVLRGGPLPLVSAAAIGAQLCDALAAAHAIGIAHGRLTPSTVLLEPGATGPWAVRLNEFGLAALLGPLGLQDPDAAVRSAFYQAPELVEGDSATASSDVYALGVLLYEALAGRPPFTKLNPAELIAQHRSAPPPPIPGLADPPARLVAACLRKNPRDRPTAARVASELAGFAVPVPVEPTQEVTARPRRPSRRLVEIAAAVVVGTLAAVTISIIAPKGTTTGVAASQDASPIVPIATGAQLAAPTTTPPTGSGGVAGLPTPSPFGAPGASTPSAIAATGASGRLANALSGKCLDTGGGFFADGVTEQLWTCDSGVGQVVTYASTGQLTEDGGAFCLDDTGGSVAVGTKVELLSCRSGAAQQWTLRSDGSIVSANSGLCVDVAAPATENGDQIELQPCDGRASQRWAWS